MPVANAPEQDACAVSIYKFREPGPAHVIDSVDQDLVRVHGVRPNNFGFNSAD